MSEKFANSSHNDRSSVRKIRSSVWNEDRQHRRSESSDIDNLNIRRRQRTTSGTLERTASHTSERTKPRTNKEATKRHRRQVRNWTVPRIQRRLIYHSRRVHLHRRRIKRKDWLHRRIDRFRAFASLNPGGEEQIHQADTVSCFLVGSCHTAISTWDNRSYCRSKRISPAGWQLGTLAPRRKVRPRPRRVLARTWLGFRALASSEDEAIHSGWVNLHTLINEKNKKNVTCFDDCVVHRKYRISIDFFVFLKFF